MVITPGTLHAEVAAVAITTVAGQHTISTVFSTQQIARRKCLHRHDATNRLAAVQYRCRPAQDFHPPDHADIEKVSTAVGEFANEEAVLHRHQFNQRQPPGATHTTNTKTATAKARVACINTDTRLSAPQVGEIKRLALLDIFLFDHGYRIHHIAG